VGRHAAADGAGTDPIVAAALARQDAGAVRRATTRGADPATETGLGWPGDTTTGGGLGWPGSTDTDEGVRDEDVQGADVSGADVPPGDTGHETARMDAVPAVPGPRESPDDEDPGPPARRGWRRMFGGTAA
jgi:hypothetical protein